MFVYMLLFALITPLAGIYMMEGGEYGPSVGEYGYHNGSTMAYAMYALCLVITAAFIVWRCSGRRLVKQISQAENGSFERLAVIILIIDILFLLVILFGAGGIHVLTGQVGKGEFRTSLGTLGAITNWITKDFTPALLAYLAYIYKTIPRHWKARLLMLSNFLIAFIIGASWGYKTTALTILLPSLLILFWRISILEVFILALITTVIVMGTYLLFDNGTANLADIATALFTRLTVIQGDVSWKIWDSCINGVHFPPYYKTLLPIVGDHVFSILTGVTKDNFYNWMLYHYGLLLTYVSGYPLWGIEAGMTITATPFSEGVIALGQPCYLAFGVFAGCIVGLNFNFIKFALARNRPILGASASTYFCFVTFAWLNGGGLLQLFHISVIIGYFMIWALLTFVKMLSSTKVNRTLHVKVEHSYRPDTNN